MTITLNSNEKKKLIYNEIDKWKKEFKRYSLCLCLYSYFILFILISFSIMLFLVNIILGIFWSVFTIIYLLGIVIPRLLIWDEIKKCNINNIYNLNIGIIQRKFYSRKKFLIYVNKDKSSKVKPDIYCTNRQFKHLLVNDKVIFFEFLHEKYGIIKKPRQVKDSEIELLKNNCYTPTEKDLELFTNFRKSITLYDNYLICIIIAIILIFGTIIGIRTDNYVNTILFIIFPAIIMYLLYLYFIAPYRPYTVDKFENCYKAMVIDKNIEKRNSVRKYYYGKTYYYISVVDEYGDRYDKIRVDKPTFNSLEKGNSVICFEYKKSNIEMGNSAAIKKYI